LADRPRGENPAAQPGLGAHPEAAQTRRPHTDELRQAQQRVLHLSAEQDGDVGAVVDLAEHLSERVAVIGPQKGVGIGVHHPYPFPGVVRRRRDPEHKTP
jgi:hypothetical protein